MTKIVKCDNCGSIDMIGISVNFGYPSAHDDIDGHGDWHFCKEDCLLTWLKLEQLKVDKIRMSVNSDKKE